MKEDGTAWTMKGMWPISTNCGRKIRRFGKFGNEKVI